jgi:methanogenic corrinoid protein MtbC1
VASSRLVVPSPLRRAPPRGPRAENPDAPDSAIVHPALRASIAPTLAESVLPRLLMRHRGDARPAGLDAAPRPSSEDVEVVTRLSYADDPAELSDYVRGLRRDGFDLERIYRDVLGPAARLLGAWWECDRCGFGHVTLGVNRMHRVVHELSPDWMVRQRRGPVRRALLAVMPGSQHTFGLLLLSEYFRRAGWAVWSDPSATLAELRAATAKQRFDVIGLSVGMSFHVDVTASVMLALRESSAQPDPVMMIGGPLFDLYPSFRKEVEADLVSTDASDAVERAEALVASRARSRR